MKKSAGYIALVIFWDLLVGHKYIYIYIIRLKSCNILYAIYMVFPGGLRRIKISPLGEDLRQGSNQVRNQVLRHQGNFCWWKGRISPHPLMLLGPLEKYSSKKLLKDMFI